MDCRHPARFYCGFCTVWPLIVSIPRFRVEIRVRYRSQAATCFGSKHLMVWRFIRWLLYGFRALGYGAAGVGRVVVVLGTGQICDP